MITILIVILVLVTSTIILRLKSRRFGSNKFKELAFVVLLISTFYFLLLLITKFIGPESTPVWVTTTNHLDKKITVYNMTIYDHPVYDNKSRFVYKGTSLNAGDSSTTIIEYDSAIEFWTVAFDDLNKIVFFNSTNSHSISEYKFNIDKSYIADNSKATLANIDIQIYNKDKLTKDILIIVDIILTLILLIEILSSKPKFNNLADNIKQ
jgi:hypothetical protein